jgi:hypothetical protein
MNTGYNKCGSVMWSPPSWRPIRSLRFRALSMFCRTSSELFNSSTFKTIRSLRFSIAKQAQNRQIIRRWSERDWCSLVFNYYYKQFVNAIHSYSFVFWIDQS